MATAGRIARALSAAARAGASRSPALWNARRSPSALAVCSIGSRRCLSSAADKVTFTYVDCDSVPSKVTANVGTSLADVAHENDIELECACGGEMACSTCHLIFEKDIYDMLPEASEEEEDMLDLAWGLTETSRLGCQIKVADFMEGMTVRIPDESESLM